MSSITRKRSGEKKYKQYRSTAGECDFCKFKPEDEQVIKEFHHHWLVTARFPYDFWDSAGVAEHLMIVPKRHATSLRSYDSTEKDEYINLLADYEEQGYSIYSRGVDAHTRTMAHVHTHLIKHGEDKRAVFYLKKPHVLLYY